MRSSLYPADELRRRTHRWALKLRVNPKAVRVQEMKRKWGSCTSRGTITLAADLADQDSTFQDFVIVHELLHLRYSSHGRVFKALLSAYVPGWSRFNVSRGEPLQQHIAPTQTGEPKVSLHRQAPRAVAPRRTQTVEARWAVL